MTIHKKNGTTLYISDRRINYMSINPIGKDDMVRFDIGVADVHGVDNAWCIIIPRPDALGIVKSHEDGDTIEYWEET